MKPTLQSMFEQTAGKYPGKEGLIDLRLGKRWTYAEWNEEANRLAQAFAAAGVVKGDKVTTILFNTAEFLTTLIACTKLGAVFNPVNFRLAENEIEFILKDAQPKIVLVEKATENLVVHLVESNSKINFWSIDSSDTFTYYYDELEAAIPDSPNVTVTEDDLYAVMYTSGTTGMPKGVLHTHRDMIDQSLALAAAMGITRGDRGLTIAPMFHCAELHCALLPRVLMGATNIVAHQFNCQVFLQAVKEEKITTFFAAPTMLNMILQQNLSESDFTSLSKILYGGAAMAPALVKRVSDVFKVSLYQAYGMTEMGPAITFLMEDEQLIKAGSAGKPLLNHDVRVVRTSENGPSDPEDLCEPGELGEIIVRGPSMMTGYLNQKHATDKVFYKGWYHSGDIGSFDEDGYLWVSDRLKDMIISGGENIYSREVEDALFEHPGVLDAAVVGEPDEIWGECVVAFILKKDPELTEEVLDDFMKNNQRIARYKRPRKYIFMDELPRNASGKLQKFKLRETFVQ